MFSTASLFSGTSAIFPVSIQFIYSTFCLQPPPPHTPPNIFGMKVKGKGLGLKSPPSQLDNLPLEHAVNRKCSNETIFCCRFYAKLMKYASSSRYCCCCRCCCCSCCCALVLAYIVVVVGALLLPQRQANFDTMPQLLMALTSQVPVAADVVLTVLLLLPQSCCQH